MPTFDRALWRAAGRLVTALESQRRAALTIPLPQRSWMLLELLTRHLSEAGRRGWNAAARSVRRSVHSQMRWLITDLQALVASVDEPDSLPLQVRDVYDELFALSAHYQDVVIDLKETKISVTIDRVTLEEIDLGRFQLVWNWSRLAEGGELTVVALEPNCCTSRTDVSHPHVQDEMLCVGEASGAMGLAADSGRLLDYFEIVECVLRTYNAGSAYVSLSEWYGTPCTGCGDTYDPDDLSSCEQCYESFCACCQTECRACGRVICYSCAVNCAECEESLCRRCRPVRSSQPACPRCLEQKRKDHDADQASAANAARQDDSAVYADSVGQAAVPARCG